ncbi:MAG: Mur ligase family protein [Candidatus Paracaedibacteraceae bacterium]|nr:Mur ligase family protein [Candidatus Paracaedibacteraceae bacterium]
MLCLTERLRMAYLHDLLNQVELLRYQGISKGLTRCFELLEKLGNPHLHMPPVFHVAGTNGKGSTLAFLKQMLEDNGYSVHRYTSPHLVHFNERIELNGLPAKNKILVTTLTEILDINANAPLTTFEIITCLAFTLFARHPADFTLLEVGMGGRLDATNLILRPLVTAITSISLDHQQDLGTTVEAIAAEKAGIIKHGVPLVLPSNLQKSAHTVIKSIADTKNAPITIAKSLPEHELGLKGTHQQSNAEIAVQMLKTADIKCINTENSLKKTTWPGRLQKITLKNKHVWIDGAHNEAAAKALTQSLQRIDPSLWIFFVHIKQRKDAKALLTHFAAIAKMFYFIDASIPGGNAVSPKELKHISNDLGVNVVAISSMQEFLNIIEKTQCPMIATGSLFLIGELLKLQSKIN